jgi:chromosome segregation ATPase
MPDETGQFPEVVKKAERLDIVKLIRKIRFETETARKMASSALKYYTQAELQQVTADMIDIASPESDRDVKRNLILALGKASTPEALELLLWILQDGKETYDMRIAALEGLSSAKTQEIVAAERTTLDSMVLNREKERKEAQKNIDETTKKIENIQTRKDELVLKNLEQQDKLNQLSMKLQEISMPTEFVDPAAPRSRVTAQEMTKLRRDIKALETSIAKQNESIVRMDEETAELQRQKLRYEGLLAKREEEKDITFQSRAPAGAIAPEETMMDAPPEMFGEPVYVETDEEKNEIIFAISLIKTLGSMRDEESLPVIKRAWDEYRVEQQRIHYLLSLARLSDFSGVDMLIARLRSDYLDGPASEEILLRAGIIEVLGDYLLQKYDDRLAGLVEYLSEEGGYPEIRKAASGVLAKIAVKPK